MRTLTFKVAREKVPVKVTMHGNMIRKILMVLMVAILLISCSKPELQQDPENEQQPELTLKSTGDFTIVVMPDIQNYMSGYFGGTEAMFTSQINWIKNNKTAQNIAYVVGVGDISEHGDAAPAEWVKAKNGYYSLESSGIPYGLAIGNHDGSPMNGHLLVSPVWTTTQYNTYFGVSHFNNTAHPYWKGNYGNNNNSHYDFFTAGGVDFIVIYVEYDHYNENATNMNTWVYDLLGTYSSRKAIVVTHYTIGAGDPAVFGTQAWYLWDRIRPRTNIFMMLGGHIPGVGYKEVTSNGHTIRAYMADYQGDEVTGGNGFMRLMRFSVVNDDVTVKTYSPFVNQYKTDIINQFTKPLFGLTPTAQVSDGRYKIIAKNSGKTIVVYNASMDNGANVVQWDYTSAPATNDEWDLEALSNGYYKILNANSGKAMCVLNASTAVGGYVIQWDYTSTLENNDEWALIPVETGYYKITARHSGLCLNVAGGGSNNGAQIKQWTFIGDDGIDNDKFRLELVP